MSKGAGGDDGVGGGIYTRKPEEGNGEGKEGEGESGGYSYESMKEPRACAPES